MLEENSHILFGPTYLVESIYCRDKFLLCIWSNQNGIWIPIESQALAPNIKNSSYLKQNYRTTLIYIEPRTQHKTSNTPDFKAHTYIFHINPHINISWAIFWAKMNTAAWNGKIDIHVKMHGYYCNDVYLVFGLNFSA